MATKTLLAMDMCDGTTFSCRMLSGTERRALTYLRLIEPWQGLMDVYRLTDLGKAVRAILVTVNQKENER